MIGDAVECKISPTERVATLSSKNESTKTVKLNDDFDPAVCHLVRVDAGISKLKITIDDAGQSAEIAFTKTEKNIVLFTEGVSVGLSAIELTRGFEELFETDRMPTGIAGDGFCNNGSLTIEPAADKLAEAAFEIGFADFELAANLSLADPGKIGDYGIAIYDQNRKITGRLTAHPSKQKITFTAGEQTVEVILPESFTGGEYRQFRIVTQSGNASAYLDGILVAGLPALASVSRGAVYSTVPVRIEMLRLTAI
jgi:hypothetical protein